MELEFKIPNMSSCDRQQQNLVSSFTLLGCLKSVPHIYSIGISCKFYQILYIEFGASFSLCISSFICQLLSSLWTLSSDSLASKMASSCLRYSHPAELTNWARPLVVVRFLKWVIYGELFFQVSTSHEFLPALVVTLQCLQIVVVFNILFWSL